MVKTNVIADRVEIEVHIATMPGDDDEAVGAHLAAALGDLATEVEVTSRGDPRDVVARADPDVTTDVAS